MPCIIGEIEGYYQQEAEERFPLSFVNQTAALLVFSHHVIPQHTPPIGPLRPKKKSTAPTAALAAAPLIRPSTVRFGPFQPCPATNNNESRPPSQPAIEVLRGTTQQEVHQKTACQESREPPSNGNNEDLSSQSKFVDKGKGLDGGKKKKSTTSKSTRSSRSSWKDDIQFDAKEQVLTIDDKGNEGMINGSILPRDVMNYKKGVRFYVAFNNYNNPLERERFCPIRTISWHKLNKTYKADIIEMVQSKFIYSVDKCFDKHVLKHVAKHFKQYKHGLKRDYKLEEKTKEDMYDIVPKGHSRDGWMRLVDYWCSKEHQTFAEIGRDARASQTHCHTTGSTSYAEKRANFVETHGREPTHLEFFKETHSKKGGGFVANTTTESFLVEIENEVFDELMYEEENPNILRKRGYIFPDNNVELKCVKEELASQKAMFLLMLKAVRNGKIKDEFLDATEAALHMAGDQVQQESSGNDLSNESRHTGPSTSTSQVN
ncbi:hypothetical protein Cgig2_020908 [Carnegiea gigantea]|uniref:Transposase n=1 Tax=Carnegiea gigantea TaxID=171969 RepID=A0A9Q1GXS0_9CARY|nr:hypothetical protein Cgig2_020908 [Carnegiea gigantea]